MLASIADGTSEAALASVESDESDPSGEEGVSGAVGKVKLDEGVTNVGKDSGRQKPYSGWQKSASQ